MCNEVENTENSFMDVNEVVGTDGEEMVTKRVHVMKRGTGWAIKKQGASRASRVYDSKQEAIEAGRRFKRLGYDLVIHKKDGSIQRLEKSQKEPTYRVITDGRKTTVTRRPKTKF